jgi:hypothetical protein
MVGAGSRDFLDGALKPNNLSNQNSSGNNHKSQQQVASF